MKTRLLTRYTSAVFAAVLSTGALAAPLDARAFDPGSASPTSGDRKTVKACQSAEVEGKKHRQEKDLLGARHADQHAFMRRIQCDVERGARTVAAKGLVKSAAQTLKDDKDIREAHFKDKKDKKDKNVTGVPFDPRGYGGGSVLAPPGLQAGVAPVAPMDPAVGGRWSEPFVVPVVGVTATLLHTGKVLFWSYDPVDYHNPANSKNGVAYLWDWSTRTGYNIAPPENIWCGGQTILSDGRVYVAGGNLRYPDPNAANGLTDWAGTLTNFTFSPLDEAWAKQPNMVRGRWYPTLTQLADNRVVITSGMDETGSGALTNQVELFTPDLNRMGIGTIRAVGLHNASGLYPQQFLLPSGQLLEAGPDAGSSFQMSTSNWSWSALPRMRGDHYYLGNGVSYSDASGATVTQTIMVAGGYNYVGDNSLQNGPVAGNEWMDGVNPSAGWRAYPQWAVLRHNANTVILADGTMLTVGGNQGLYGYEDALFVPELYSKPIGDKTGIWKPMAPHAIQAAYHSSALLLPDATVMLSQDDMDYSAQAAFEHKLQVYAPPYLFKGPQPVITQAPATLTYGQSFTVSTDRDGMVSAMLVAPGATTHSNDMHQRAIKLKVLPRTNGLSAQVPASRALVPPGYYMLFVLDAAGIPSAAKFVRIT